MDRIFSTDSLHPRDRFDYWHEVASERIIGHRSRPENRSTFEAELHAGTLADIGLLLVTNSPMGAVRTPRHVARVADDNLLICLQLAGKVIFEQDGREAVLQENDFCLMDPLRTSNVNFFDGSKILVVKLARHSVEARVGKTHDMTARSISRGGSIGSLTASFLNPATHPCR